MKRRVTTTGKLWEASARRGAPGDGDFHVDDNIYIRHELKDSSHYFIKSKHKLVFLSKADLLRYVLAFLLLLFLSNILYVFDWRFGGFDLGHVLLNAAGILILGVAILLAPTKTGLNARTRRISAVQGFFPFKRIRSHAFEDVTKIKIKRAPRKLGDGEPRYEYDVYFEVAGAPPLEILSTDRLESARSAALVVRRVMR